uniref:NADH-ubiquinone oxidoreductase chain 6 n=1 Tax=Heteromycteris japonicus TaxID=195614 RepID=A0A088AXB0_9PLEU|nr:NADH dehydrogenase subunit 6 [Heteromycteris japonicus]AFC77842.1 NADH dehydrogenase subunit 6 [Heteromycteris japonicus]
MTFFMWLVLFSLLMGMTAVASNPSPYFAALGLVLVAGVGCLMLLWQGGTFLSLILFLIYLGGMLVVFAYSAALASEPYPMGWGSWPVLSYVGGYLVVLIVLCHVFGLGFGWTERSWVNLDEGDEFILFRGDSGGLVVLFSSGGFMLLLGGWALLLTLFAVLELTRGLSRGALRAV